MIVIGIDPGSNIAGLAVLEYDESSESISLLALDYYESKAKEAGQKMFEIVEQMKLSLEEFEADYIVLEDVFTGKNIQSTLRLAEMRGAISYVAHTKAIPVVHVPTRKVKKSISGNGHASKEDVALHLREVFSLGDASIPLDATDALALSYYFILENQKNKKIVRAEV